MTNERKRICILAATPLTVHFFLKPHLLALAQDNDLTLMVNLKNDSYLPALTLPIEIIDIPIARKMAPLADLKCLFKLIFLFQKTQYDLLITVVPKAGLLGMLAGAFCKIPARLHIFQGEVWANLYGFKRYLFHRCDQITATLATHVLAVSESERRFLIIEKVVQGSKISVLGKGSIGGVDLDRFSPNENARQEARRELGIPSDAMAMIFIGRLVADKGIHELIEAYKRIAQMQSNFWLLLVGPDEEGELGKLNLGQFENRVKRVAYTSEPEKYLAAADFLCLPSHREGFGVVIIEAAAIGLPAIASNIYGISDAVLDRTTGLLFECRNVDELQKAIHLLVSDSDVRADLGANAFENVKKHFDSRDVVKNYIQYIHHLLEDNA
jgi:glycosyltransferase involved in cell wall biosynthesis